MTPEAQDALLKTLEEPPSAAIVILVTALPDLLLPTIQSRCRRLRFALLSEADVARVLVERAGISEKEAHQLAARSGGRVSRALARESGDFEDDREAALAVLSAARTGALGSQLKAAGALARHGSDRRDREALADRLAIVASLVRDLGAIGAGAPPANIDLVETLGKLAPAFALPRVASAFDAVVEAEQALRAKREPEDRGRLGSGHDCSIEE